MKLLILGTLIMVSVGCEITKEDIDYFQCEADSAYVSSVEFYPNSISGKSCEYLKSREYVYTSTCMEIGVTDASNSDQVFSNDPIENIYSGENIFIDDKQIFSVRSRSLYVEDKKTLELVHKVPLTFSADKVYKASGFIAVADNQTLFILDLNFEEIFSRHYDQKIDLKFKGDQIHISYSSVANQKTDEDFCRSIKYVDNSKGSSLFTTEVYDGAVNEITDSNHYFGRFQAHVDESSSYVFKNDESSKTMIIKEGNDELTTIVEGVVQNSSYLKEYSESLHVITHSWISGSNYTVLDRSFNTISEIKKIAVGEMLRAVKFGKKFSYIMTFEFIDPLFVFDLENTDAPKVVGELKFPGMPHYLTDISDSHLVSINTNSDRDIEISFFDVSMPDDPIRVSSTVTEINLGWREFSFKNILINNKHIVFKNEDSIEVYSLFDNKFTFNTKIKTLNKIQVFLDENSLYLRDGRQWRLVDLND